MSAPVGRLLTREMLDALEQLWRAGDWPIASRLSPGLSDAEMDGLTASLGLQLPSEGRTWWGWHDGVPAERTRTWVERDVGAGWRFMPLSEAVERCGLWREISEETAEIAADLGVDEPVWWAASWFPVTDVGQGGILALDCAVPEGSPSPIRYVLPPEGQPQPRPRLSSLGELVAGWIEGLERGAWTYAHGVWNEQPELVPSTAKLLAG